MDSAVLLQRITREPRKLGGKPCIRGLRFPVAEILELLSNVASHQEILEDHPDLEQDDIYAALVFAARNVNRVA